MSSSLEITGLDDQSTTKGRAKRAASMPWTESFVFVVLTTPRREALIRAGREWRQVSPFNDHGNVMVHVLIRLMQIIANFWWRLSVKLPVSIQWIAEIAAGTINMSYQTDLLQTDMQLWP